MPVRKEVGAGQLEADVDREERREKLEVGREEKRELLDDGQ